MKLLDISGPDEDGSYWLVLRSPDWSGIVNLGGGDIVAKMADTYKAFDPDNKAK